MGESLTKKQKAYVHHRSRGVGREQSIILAKYEGGATASRIENTPSVRQELAKIRRELATSLGITREDVANLFIEAAATARSQGDAMGMIAAGRELGRLLGHYAPEGGDKKNPISKDEVLKAMEQMTDEELYRLSLAKEKTIDGESRRIDEDVPTGPGRVRGDETGDEVLQEPRRVPGMHPTDSEAQTTDPGGAGTGEGGGGEEAAEDAAGGAEEAGEEAP